VYSGYVHVLKDCVPKSFMILPTRKRDARTRMAQIRHLHHALIGRNASMTRHVAELRTEVSVRWSTGTLADVLQTAAEYAVQTLDGLQFMAVPLEQIVSSVERWAGVCEELCNGRDDIQLSERAIDMAAHAMNECGVAVDRVLRLLTHPSAVTGKYRWEERPTAPVDGIIFSNRFAYCYAYAFLIR